MFKIKSGNNIAIASGMVLFLGVMLNTATKYKKLAIVILVISIIINIIGLTIKIKEAKNKANNNGQK
jgi:hypothetical protein